MWRDENGATLITVAITLVLLLGAAALAIDLAAGWNERRQDQTASDLAAMAGALSFGDNDAIVVQVMATARLNVDTQYTDAEWTALWTGCSDTDRPAGFAPITHSDPALGTLDCISVNPSFLRVRLPDQLVETSFARVLGINTLTTHADTIVTLLPLASSFSLPFAIRGNSTAGEICLDTGTTGQAQDPCDGSESGSFGNIAPPLFGFPPLGTTPDCIGQANGENVAEAIAIGIDHFLFWLSASDWVATGWSPDDSTSNNAVDAAVNMDECDDTGGEVAEAADGVPIEGVYVDTGNSVRKDATEGLITGIAFSDGFDARLTRSLNTRLVDIYQLDNTPLWSHLFDYPGNSFDINECDGDTYAGLSLAEKNDRIRTCVEKYQDGPANDGVPYETRIFADTIVNNNPRLGTAPRLWHNNLGSGLAYRPIQTFDLVYIHGLWFDDKADTVFYPDDADSSDITLVNWKDVEQVTAFLLLDTMVSDFVHDEVGKVALGLFDPTIYE